MHVSCSQIEAEIRDSMRRCSESAIAAAIEYHETKDVALVPPIVFGIIERYIEPEARQTLKEGGEDIRLVDDLGIDSLLMVEIIILIEDCLGVSVENEELRLLRTVGEVNTFLRAKVSGEELPVPTRHYGVAEISSALPYELTRLHLQEAVVNGQYAEASYRVEGARSHFEQGETIGQDSSSDLVVETIQQLAMLFLLKSERSDLPPRDAEFPTLEDCEGVRHLRPCLSGETLNLRVELGRIESEKVQFRAHASGHGGCVSEIDRLEFRVGNISNVFLPRAKEA